MNDTLTLDLKNNFGGFWAEICQFQSWQHEIAKHSGVKVPEISIIVFFIDILTRIVRLLSKQLRKQNVSVCL